MNIIPGPQMECVNTFSHFGKYLTVCLLTVSFGLGSSQLALAQSTPTELADLTLEDLLSLDVEDEGLNSEKKKDRLEFSYTYRRLSSGNYRSGTKDFTFEDVLFSPGEVRTDQNFPVVPTFICQHVHAFSANYTINEKLSLNFAVPYIRQGTDHISSVPNFSEFLLTSEGIGDIGVSASYLKRLKNSDALQFNAGIRIPTGSIDEMGDTPRNGAGTLERLPYTMQIGSGTVDFSGSVGYSKAAGNLRLGISANTTLRTGKNDHNYRLGNNYGLNATAQYTKNAMFQPGLRINLRKIERIKGGDTSLQVPAVFPFPASITNPENYGGTKVKLAATLRFCPTRDCKVSLTGEYGVPILQDLNGIQPQDRNYISFSASTKF